MIWIIVLYIWTGIICFWWGLQIKAPVKRNYFKLKEEIPSLENTYKILRKEVKSIQSYLDTSTKEYLLLKNESQELLKQNQIARSQAHELYENIVEMLEISFEQERSKLEQDYNQLLFDIKSLKNELKSKGV